MSISAQLSKHRYRTRIIKYVSKSLIKYFSCTIVKYFSRHDLSRNRSFRFLNDTDYNRGDLNNSSKETKPWKYLRCRKGEGCRVPTSPVIPRSMPDLLPFLLAFLSKQEADPPASRSSWTNTPSETAPESLLQRAPLITLFLDRVSSVSFLLFFSFLLLRNNYDRSGWFDAGHRSLVGSRNFLSIQTINRTYWSCSAIQFRFGCDRTGSSSPSPLCHIRCHENLISGNRRENGTLSARHTWNFEMSK